MMMNQQRKAFFRASGIAVTLPDIMGSNENGKGERQAKKKGGFLDMDWLGNSNNRGSPTRPAAGTLS
jgi:hypothetical protein